MLLVTISLFFHVLFCVSFISSHAYVDHFADIDNPPISRAGPDVVLHWPQNSVVLHGDGSTDDVGIVNYEWIYNPQSTQEFSLDMMVGCLVFLAHTWSSAFNYVTKININSELP